MPPRPSHPGLSPVTRKFILHWGEMGSRWGVNRTVAQVHALLYLSPRPVTAEEIAQTLGVARSNVSQSLRELRRWGLLQAAPVLGDRRDHFRSVGDVWEMAQVILETRKRREVDPALTVLRECAAESRRKEVDAHTRARVEQMLDFFETMTAWYEQMRRLPTSALKKVVRMGSRIVRMGSKAGSPVETAP